MSHIEPVQSGLGFALTLRNARVMTRPLPDEWRACAIPRAPRFSARLVVWCRFPGEGQWHQGVTENISSTGILFRTELPVPLQPKTVLEIALEIPSQRAQDAPIEFRSHAEVVRVERDLPEMLPRVAVALRVPVDPWSATDGFAFILTSVSPPPQAVPDRCPGGTPRAPRYVVRLRLRYRLSGIDEWYEGETENVSRSGLAFQTDRSDLDFAVAHASDDGVSMEILIELRGKTDLEPGMAVCCQGLLVRTCRDLGMRGRTRVAVRLRGQFEVGSASPVN